MTKEMERIVQQMQDHFKVMDQHNEEAQFYIEQAKHKMDIEEVDQLEQILQDAVLLDHKMKRFRKTIITKINKNRKENTK